MSHVHMNFPGLPRKLYIHTYDVLGILAIISGAIFVENILFSNFFLWKGAENYAIIVYFSALFHKKIKETKRKLKKQNCHLCT